jgi:hypothetical protein
MTDWTAVARARGLDIPEDAVRNIAPSLTGLEATFRPLLARLPFSLEPVVILSEPAVLGE